jgi:hypothetical protein
MALSAQDRLAVAIQGSTGSLIGPKDGMVRILDHHMKGKMIQYPFPLVKRCFQFLNPLFQRFIAWFFLHGAPFEWAGFIVPWIPRIHSNFQIRMGAKQSRGMC